VLRNVERDVELMAVVSPRDEHKLAFLLVEREVADVERAIGVGDGREHPQHLALRRHDRVRAHAVAETVVDAAFTPSPRSRRNTKPRLHDTTYCQTGCETGLTTGCTTGCIVYTNIQPVVSPVAQPAVQLYCRLDNRLQSVNKVRRTSCHHGCTTGWTFVYTMQPVVQPVVQPD